MEGADLANALADYEIAKNGTTAEPPGSSADCIDVVVDESSVSIEQPSAPIRRSLFGKSPIEPSPAVPVRSDDRALIVPNLMLPRGDQWWDDSKYVIGKKFALPPYDQSAALKADLECYRMFWSLQDSPGRDGEALSSVTLSKRVSRVLLFLGFLDLIKAVEDPKSLTLSACLSHAAVEKYCEWSLKQREMLNSNVAENLSAMTSVCKFLYRGRPEASSCEIVQCYRTMRNRLTSKVNMMHKSSADLTEEGRWLSWDTFRAAIAELQSDFDRRSEAEDEPTIDTARLLMDLTMLRIYEASPSRSGEIRHLEYLPIDEINAVKRKFTVAKWVSSKRKKVITRRNLSCWEMLIGNSKTTKHHGIDEV